MAYKVLVVDDRAMPRQLFENIIKSSDNYDINAGCQFPGDEQEI